MGCYDEFSLLQDNADEAGLPWSGPPPVERRDVAVDGGRHLSALVWGDGPPDLVLLHGGAQNAHTWDTVALALDRPLLAVDLPGHGHSAWRDDGAYSLSANADDVAAALAQLAPVPRLVVGMSLGGLTALSLAERHPHMVQSLLLVDVTPGVDHGKAEAVVRFVDGPESFESFDALLARTIEHNPTRSESSLRRGVLHNARPADDGTWAWRYDRRFAGDLSGLPRLWDVLEARPPRLSLVRGGASPVVDDADVAELRARRPDAEVHVVEGAGHSIQGDRPLELAALIRTLLA